MVLEMSYVTADKLEVGMETAEGFVAEVVHTDNLKTYVNFVLDENSMTDENSFINYSFRSDELLEIF